MQSLPASLKVALPSRVECHRHRHRKPLLSIIFLSISALHGFVLLLVGEGQVPASARKNMAVVVTGCDTGFGAALAPALAEDGYTVFACCLKKERWASAWL